MAYSTTILNQIASFFPRHDFEKLAHKHHRGQKFRSFNRWSQFLAMTIAQLTSRKSLRDLVGNILVQKKRMYHLGMKPTSRATLARVNEQQPHETYQEMFFQILQKCQARAPKHNFKFKGKVYLLDATTVNLCLSVFPWATYRKTKGAVKLHFGLDADGHLPVFMNMTEGKKHEIEWARSLNLPSGSCVVFDRGFTDYSWYDTLDKRKITFVTRLKSNAKVYEYGNRRKPDSPDVIEDQKVKFRGYRFTFRRIIYVDPETNITYQFLTNSRKLKASEVAALYKERWQIGVSSKGHITQSVKVRPRSKDSNLVAWEAPWRETKTVEPSDNVSFKGSMQNSRPQRTVNVDVASLHANPVAETVDNVRRQQGLTEKGLKRQSSPAGYQRWHGVKGYVETGEALDIRRRKLAEEANPITLNGKWVSRYQGGGLGCSTVDRRATKRARREGPRLMGISFVQSEVGVG